MTEQAKPLLDPDRVRRRLPEYFTILYFPWHLAFSLMGRFVNDDDCVVSDYGHIRNLFHVAQALAIEAKSRAPSREDEVRALVAESDRWVFPNRGAWGRIDDDYARRLLAAGDALRAKAGKPQEGK